ncbi:hypothetical protein L1D32_09240 [Shewanella insulae]|uniref:hypothetical protein n=1 Tax=Shewanella insulae TaxID=2681496 RepID=UPI001EFCF6CC|nr:hypothetical protein [Shewanella insulae]MCG9738338.1 hypothetical protein [Shewanella insulae]
MGRRYRRRSQSSQIILDSVFIVSRLPWWGALLFGLALFLIFYFAVPYWLESRLSAGAESNVYPALEALYGRAIKTFHYIGIATGVGALFFSISNYFVIGTNQSEQRSLAAFIARLLGRQLN